MVDMISHGKPLMIHNKKRIHFLILVKDMDLQKEQTQLCSYSDAQISSAHC